MAPRVVPAVTLAREVRRRDHSHGAVWSRRGGAYVVWFGPAGAARTWCGFASPGWRWWCDLWDG
ncbi:hypothetical protein Skr01_31770 [Sphaerisporangium krabiense]|nr:hypothetical protein Skr01_31770 [Sphaerisporangium krabiense]